MCQRQCQRSILILRLISPYLPHRAATFAPTSGRLIAPNRIERNLTLDKIREHVLSTRLFPLLFQPTIVNSEVWCSELAEALTNVFFANEHKGQLFVLQ